VARYRRSYRVSSAHFAASEENEISLVCNVAALLSQNSRLLAGDVDAKYSINQGTFTRLHDYKLLHEII
jgi:hypothetical protein